MSDERIRVLVKESSDHTISAIRQAYVEGLKRAMLVAETSAVNPLPHESGADVRKYHNRAVGMVLSELARLVDEEAKSHELRDC